MNDDQLKRLWCKQKLDAAKLSSGDQIKLMRIKTKALHRVSLWLLRQQQPGTGFTGFKYLNLLEKPLPDGLSIRIRQIVSLIRATELYARRKSTRFGRELNNEDPAPPWMQILPGSPHYPKMIDRPDGRRGGSCAGAVCARGVQADSRAYGAVFSKCL